MSNNAFGFKEYKTNIKVKSVSKKKLIFGYILIFWFLLGTLFIADNIWIFISTHDFRSPIQAPWTTKTTIIYEASKSAMINTAYADIKVSPTPVKSRENTSELLDGIFLLESTRGKNDGCKDKGQYNGYGYAQSTFTWNCFDTQEEVVARVTNWIEDKILKGYSDSEILCYYNTGIRQSDCPYFQKYLIGKGVTK